MGERFTYSGAVTREQLSVRQRRDPHPDCDTCGGEGVYGADGDSWDCACCTEVFRTPTPADLVAHVAALPGDEARALLVALLRARPDEALDAMSACRVARPWVGDSGARDRWHAGVLLSHTVDLLPKGTRWRVFDVLGVTLHTGTCDNETEAMAAADAALVADGWVLAKGVTP